MRNPPVVSLSNPLDDSGWDARLSLFPAATFFHTAPWARVLHDTYGFTPVCFTSGPAKEPVNLFPMMEVDSWLTGRRAVTLPFTDECGPLCHDRDSIRTLFQAAVAHGRDRGWKYIEIRGGRDLFGDAPASTSYWGHRLALETDETALFARMQSSVRRAVRKAEQSGLTLEVSTTLDAVRTFHRLLCQTRKRHGVPPQPFRFFASIHRHVLAAGHGCVVLARQGQQAVAGAVYFRHGQTAIYKFGASDETFQHLRGNNLVMWEAIKWHARQGCAVLEFGRTSLDNDGLRKFKLGWGTTEYPIEYVRYNLRAARYVTAGDDSSGWHNRVFQRMPVPVSRFLGALLYRHVA